jgi:hypothetical protein
VTSESVSENTDARQDIDIDAVPTDWEALADAGRSIARSNDNGRWALGDLTEIVARHYTDQSLESYASEVQVHYKTLLSYRTVAAFYPQSTRGEFPALSWNHYKACARLKDLALALDMLEQAEGQNWSSRQLTDAINVALGRPPVRRPIVDLVVTADDGSLRVDDGKLIEGASYVVKVYANDAH